MVAGARLAWLLRVATLGQWLAAAGWLLWRWRDAPAQAMVGALAVMLVVPVVFLLQFMLLAWVARADTVPRATPGEMLRAWWAEVRLLAPVFYWNLPFRWRSMPDCLPGDQAGRGRGVVLVHGFLCNRGFWLPWLPLLRARRIPFVVVDLAPVFGSIDCYVATVEEAVQRLGRATGHPPVLVCHSMGGLAARAWLRLPNHAPVRHVVTIGTPHRGTWLGRFSHATNGRQMRLHSDWLASLPGDAAAAGMPPFTCWYSNSDNIVFPTSSATLAGADNRMVRGAAHVELAFLPQVQQATLELL